MQYQLKSRQVCLFFIAFLPVIKIFTLPSVVSSVAREDLWLCAVINFTIDLLTLGILILACKKSSQTFYSLVESFFGKTGGKIVFALYFIYFMVKAVIPLNEQKDYVQYTLYTLVPTMFYFMPFFFACAYICLKRLTVLGRAGDIMWVITLIGFFLLLVLSFSNVDLKAILPIGANGIKNILKGSFFSLGWFGDCVYFTFFMGEFYYQKKDGVKIILSYLIGAILVILFMIVFFGIFTSIAFRQRFALTEISKYTTVINNTGRLDYLGIMSILLSNVFSLSLPLFFASKLLQRIVNTDKIWICVVIVTLFHVGFMFFLSEYYLSIENFIINHGGYLFLIFSNLFPVVLSIFSLIKAKRSVYAQG